MKKVRTHLEDRVLPSYTKGEEIFNMVSHIAGGALAIAALVLCVIFAVIHTDAWGVVGAAIYGSTMVVLYAMSSIYHGLKPEMPKKVFQVIDHCTIYFLIAGTYTPVTLTALRPQYPVQAFVIFGIVWACCFIAATLTAIDLKKYQILSMICYLAMGWCIIFFIKPTVQCLVPAEPCFCLPAVLLTRLVQFCMVLVKRKNMCIPFSTCSWWREVFCTFL